MPTSLQSFIHQAVTTVKTTEDLRRLKRAHAASEKISMFQNRTILTEYRKMRSKNILPAAPDLEQILRIRRVRTLSGVAPIAVHTKPLGCPGKCIYCPTEDRMPKSYLSTQPAVKRSLANDFDPQRMVTSRIQMLESNGHATDKCELIVMGGTWSAHPKAYQEAFIKGCFDGFNGRPAQSLEEAQAWNETAHHRCIGMTLETRPDWVDEDEVARWRQLGATRVELGVQSVFPDVLDLIQRGHGVEAVWRATALFKSAGFKITYHLMPGLPGSTPERDREMFQTIFSDPRYQPDQIKIYPCLVNEHAELYQWWKDGRFTPYDDDTLDALLGELKKAVPPHVRIARIFRDFPSKSIQAGSTVTNIRQLLQERLRKQGTLCVCLRCREARNQKIEDENLEFVLRSYPASAGTEHFLSFESHDRRTLYAFLRLRFNSSRTHPFLPELNDAALVRELHTYGELIPIGENSTRVQHLGLGKELMARAEAIANEYGWKKLAVIAGIGVRAYYRKLGYHLEGTYMIKKQY
jgi:elongator complex protein 3